MPAIGIAAIVVALAATDAPAAVAPCTAPGDKPSAKDSLVVQGTVATDAPATDDSAAAPAAAPATVRVEQASANGSVVVRVPVVTDAPAAARGEQASAKDYVVVRGTVVSLQNEASRRMDVGPGIEVAVQRAFYPFLEGEISVGYSRNGTIESTNAPYPAGGTYSDVLVDQKLYVTPVTVAIRAILPDPGVEPYLVVGGGIFFATVEERPRDSNGATISASQAPFGYFFGVGAKMHISPRLFAGLEGRYQFVNTVPFVGGDRWSLNAVTASVGVGYRF